MPALQPDPVPPLLPGAGPVQSRAILAAMRAVAEAGATPSGDTRGDTLGEADRQALASADRYLFGHPGPFSAAALPPVPPEDLAAALRGTALAEEAMRFLTVMAFVGGTLDKARIAAVLRYAAALGIHARYLDEIADAARDRLAEALADMTRCNLESLTGRAVPEGDAAAWLMPYAGAGADPVLEARFGTLGLMAEDSFGHAFWRHFRQNGYAFPGDPRALNADFALPHDTVHVLTGYGTHPRGEILASTFTASMHRAYPMAGHVLPVLISWHLGLRINDVAQEARGALDPAEFWRAWAAGAASPVDSFAPGWDFWASAPVPLAELRRQWGLPAAGLAA